MDFESPKKRSKAEMESLKSPAIRKEALRNQEAIVEGRKSLGVKKPTKEDRMLNLINLAGLSKNISEAIQVVCLQVHPDMMISPAAIKLLKNYLLYVLDELLQNGLVLERDGKKIFEVENTKQVVKKVFRDELSLHALNEAEKVSQFGFFVLYLMRQMLSCC
jgi:hypothetical protein